MQPAPPREVEARWRPPGQREVRSYANSTDATEVAAYCLALAATELTLGLTAVARAEAATGGDWYLVSQDTSVPRDGHVDWEPGHAVLFEVSGLDADSDSKLTSLLVAKADQVRRQGWRGEAFAGVVGFLGHRVWLKKA